MLTQQRYVDPFPTRHDPPAVNDLFSEEFRFTGNRLGCIVSGDFTADYQTREQERDLMFSSNQGPNANFNREAHHRLAGLENQNAASQGTYGLGSATVLPLQPTQSGRTPSPMHQPNASQDGLQILNQRHLGPAQASRNDPQVHYFTQQSSPQAGNAGSQWKGVPGLTASQLQATQEAIRRQVCDQDAALRASQQQRQHGLGQNEPRASGQGASPRRQPGQANGFVQGDAQQALQADPSDIGADLFPKLGSIDSTDEGLYNDGGSQANMHPTPHPPLSQGTKRKAPEDFLCDFDQLPSKHSKTENDLQGDSFSWACEEYPEIGQVGEFDWLDYVTFDEEFGPSGKLAMGDGLGESNANATEIEGATKSGNKIPSTDTFTPLATPHAHGSASSPGWEPPLANSNGPSASALPNLAVDELPETDPAQESTPPRVVPLEYQNTKFERALEGNDWIPADYNISWHREALREFEEEQPRQTSAQRESKVLGDPIRQAIQRRVMHGVSASNDRYISVSESRGGFTQPAFNQTHGGSFGSATWTQAWMKNCPSNDKVEAHDAESRAFHLKAQADDTDPIGHALTKPTNFPIEYDEEDQQMLEDLIRRSQV
ncbi:hypothetical protein BJ875DRAFT_452221 [Amylocarpus encephaloides]|uniref:Uncharacterized protein n=1 Tax=Amylocarpus encephaloides TaxID=45428 RepID=A0A9P7YQH1_9HELO|nr:hypothetical protein BJ875DRAFT_452221 [Amylocarpus encephaloides]